MIAPALPASLAPPAPFAAIVTQSATSEVVAPGVRRATYRLATRDGPLVVNVIAIDPREPTVRFETVVAGDRLISQGETVSAMARRSGAVAGVNADYFDIGNTNQPLNLVVRAGALLRTPSSRVAFDVHADRTVHFENFSFAGSVQYGGTSVPLTGINEWPPQAGASLLTPAYGAIAAAPGVTVEELVPVDAAHAAGELSGSYRVAAVDDTSPPVANGLLLAFGPAAKARALPPVAGDFVAIAVALQPALEGIACAVGGGPLLLAAGRPVADPNAPAPEETNVRFPVAGAATTPDGDVLFASVDGRNPSLSIGVTRPQFAALFVGLGASDAMAFDSGGSATLVARVLGDRDASVLNAPSDGRERPVADGMFAYSDAPYGPATALVVRPSPIVALPHALVPLSLRLVDAAGHALGTAHLAHGDTLRAAGVSGTARLEAGGISTWVPVEVVSRVERLVITPDPPNPDPGQAVALEAAGFDARGRVVQLGDGVRWSADRGSFSAPGRYRAGAGDAQIVAQAAGMRASITLRVGRHEESLPWFDPIAETQWHFASAPAGAPGNLSFAAGDELDLSYDLSGGERAAFAATSLALPGEPHSFSVEVRGDGSAVELRVAFLNRFGERRALTLAQRVDWTGWQTRTVALPADLTPPLRLVALYALKPPAAPAGGGGSLGFRDATAVVAGTP